MSDTAPVLLPMVQRLDTSAVYSVGPPATENLIGFVRYDPDKGIYIARDRGSPTEAATVRRFQTTEAAVVWLKDKAAGIATSRAAAARRRMQDPDKRAGILDVLARGRAVSHAKRRASA